MRSDAAKEMVKMACEDKERKIRQLAEGILMQWVGIKPFVVTSGKPEFFFNPTEENTEYILIPGGTYKFSVIGQMIQVPDLYFAKYPVINKFYNFFLESLPENERNRRRSRYANDKRFNDDDQPVVGISWYDAMAYCEWLNKLQETSGKAQERKILYRLPTEEEWEWAASGGHREYPWGDEKPDDTRANYGKKVGQTTPIGSYPAGATPEGLMDIAGNVWEWTESLYEGGQPWRALRGGSWNDPMDNLCCTARYDYSLGNLWNCFGFRVVRTQS
jgi:formylglycine-generating enzyme required for sulfatase activity